MRPLLQQVAWMPVMSTLGPAHGPRTVTKLQKRLVNRLQSHMVQESEIRNPNPPRIMEAMFRGGCAIPPESQPLVKLDI